MEAGTSLPICLVLKRTYQRSESVWLILDNKHQTIEHWTEETQHENFLHQNAHLQSSTLVDNTNIQASKNARNLYGHIGVDVRKVTKRQQGPVSLRSRSISSESNEIDVCPCRQKPYLVWWMWHRIISTHSSPPLPSPSVGVKILTPDCARHVVMPEVCVALP